MTRHSTVARAGAVLLSGIALLTGCTQGGIAREAHPTGQGTNCTSGPTTAQRRDSLIPVTAASTTEVSPDAQDAHRRGVLAAMAGDYESALDAFKRAIFLQPDFAEAYRCTGLVLMELSRQDEALGAYQEAIRLAPDFALAYMNMAAVLGRLGRPAEGLRAYREGARLEPPLARSFQGLEQHLMNSRSRQLTDPTQRLYFTHFSVLPPVGGNWIVDDEGRNHIVFSRVNVGRGRFHTIVATAELVPVPEELQNLDRLQDHVERQYRSGSRESQLTPLEVRVAQVRLGGTGCIRFDGRAEEHGNPSAEGRVLIFEIHEYSCPSPVTSMVVVKLAYSQRFPEGAQPLSVEDEITPFLNGMKFRL